MLRLETRAEMPFHDVVKLDFGTGDDDTLYNIYSAFVYKRRSRPNLGMSLLGTA